MSQPGDQDDRSRSRTVLLATDISQSVIGEIVDGRTHTIAYSAYGEQSAQQNVETRLGFNGQLRETNIGWYLLGNGYRAYNPRLMRFHSPDSLSPFDKGGLNTYMYCGGEPVMSFDPTGHFVMAITRGILSLTKTTGLAATRAISHVASTASSAASSVLGVVHRSVKSVGKLVSDNLLPSQGMRNLGPPPPKSIQLPPANRIFDARRYKNPYDSPYISPQPRASKGMRPSSQFHSQTVSGTAVKRNSSSTGTVNNHMTIVRGGV